MPQKTSPKHPPFRVNAKFPELIAAGKCLTGDGNPATIRGLCRTCYARQQKQIKAGDATEQEFIDAGWRAAEVKPGGRKAKVQDPLADQIEARRAAVAKEFDKD